MYMTIKDNSALKYEQNKRNVNMPVNNSAQRNRKEKENKISHFQDFFLTYYKICNSTARQCMPTCLLKTFFHGLYFIVNIHSS